MKVDVIYVLRMRIEAKRGQATSPKLLCWEVVGLESRQYVTRAWTLLCYIQTIYGQEKL